MAVQNGFDRAKEHRLDDDKAQFAKLLKQEKLVQRQLAEELKTYKNYVAQSLPQATRGLKSDREIYAGRTLASVLLRSPEVQLLGVGPEELIAKGKQEFKKKHYKESYKLFKEVSEKFSDSPYIVESFFLQAESAFQNRDYEKYLESTNKMVTLFPENEMTGFLLLRLGQIYESQDRFREADQVYKTIVGSFQNTELKKQAELKLRQ